MELLEIKHLQNFVEANPLPSFKPHYPILNKPLNQEKTEVYQQILSYLTFHDYTSTEIEELKEILNFNTSLEQTKIKEWTQKNLNFFNENLFLFGIDYFDVVDNNNENIYLHRLDEYVDKMPFLSIIQFWDCMWLLYFGQYHLDIKKRSPPDPVGSYYYTIPDPNEPKDIEKILNYLELA